MANFANIRKQLGRPLPEDMQNIPRNMEEIDPPMSEESMAAYVDPIETLTSAMTMGAAPAILSAAKSAVKNPVREQTKKNLQELRKQNMSGEVEPSLENVPVITGQQYQKKLDLQTTGTLGEKLQNQPKEPMSTRSEASLRRLHQNAKNVEPDFEKFKQLLEEHGEDYIKEIQRRQKQLAQTYRKMVGRQ